MIHSHQSLYSGDVHVKQQRRSCKTKLSYLQNLLSCLRRLNNHVTHVTIICVREFKPEFQKYKARKCNKLYQRKKVKGQYFWKTSFWLHKVVIRTHFKNQIQYGTCVTCKIHLILKVH